MFRVEVRVAVRRRWQRGCAMGTDTGGSIRLPASYCGVMGFKPSYGRISRAGLVAYASTLDTVGILAKDIRSISCIFDAIAGVDPKDPTSRNSARDLTFHPLDAKATPSLKEAVVGIPREYFLTELDKRTTQAWRDCIRQLKRDGATLKSVSLPNTRYALPAYYIIALSEASSNLARYDGIKFGHQANHAANFSTLLTQTREEGFGLEVKRRILLGTYALTSEAVDSYYLQALKVRRLVKQDFDAVFSNECVDFLLTPTTIGPSPDNVSSLNSIASYLNDVFTVPPSLAGIRVAELLLNLFRDPGH
ncbi:hypothetical protein L0F63_004944 [Massospora cicadina]|nr:hypothetical protein L0F63_004944 [Massospora cicadina]